ncbi:hypothetical protein PSHT_12674 [Puccinia striiformis]|uniref:DUF7872 domain-containing protein n=1 Tax=Puccinia striiformis TaxID=27350 RepID=A0A2S4UVB8_9BASI|nr:hypothetical protein PSHT_12674 [Puccinia striiformis]
MVRRSLVPTTYSPEIWLLLASSTFLIPAHAALNPALSQLHNIPILPDATFFHPLPALAITRHRSLSNLRLRPLPANSACTQPLLSNSTWIQLGIDNYLANLPNGASLNLQHYAASVGAPDFICGIGEKCQAGQLCSPVQAPGWEVLVAAQEWNNYQNRFYEAVGTAVQMLTGGRHVPSQPHRPHLGYIPKFQLGSWHHFRCHRLPTYGWRRGGRRRHTSFAHHAKRGRSHLWYVGVISIQEALKKRGPNAFDKFSVYAFYLSEWQKHAQKSIANSTRSAIAAGVSSPEGISTVLKNGTFFRERPLLNEAEIVSSLKNTTTVRILTDILRSQGAFVTIASVSPTLKTLSQWMLRLMMLLADSDTLLITPPQDKCTDKGPGGAWKGNNKLSYCSPNGTMFNIIHSHKKKSLNTWWNAELISKKYGISVEYLTAQSYFYLSAECISNLPVCDFRNPDLAEAKKEKNTVHACRNVAKLPI